VSTLSKYAVLTCIGAEARNLLVRRGLNVITEIVSCLSAEDLVGLMGTCFQLKSRYFVLSRYITRRVSTCTVCVTWIVY